MDCCPRPARHGTTATSKESGVPTSCHASRNVRGAFPLPGKVQGQAERPDIQQVRYRALLRNLQRGFAGDCRAAVGGGTERATCAKDSSRTSEGILKQLLAGQRPGIHDLARELHLSTRTLQRRLTEEGITFQRLLDEARRELARHYLLHSSRELNKTAYLLGYEDANSFFRAFHHWEGTSPGQWRLLQKNLQPTRPAQLGAA